MECLDVIIIGSGIAGLYSAYKIKQISPQTNFLILEQYKKQWIGGRTSNDTFYGTEIVTGAGIGRKDKDILLYKLLQEFKIKPVEYTVNLQYSQLLHPIDIISVLKRLRKEYKNYKHKEHTFKEFATSILGQEEYHKFILSAGYTDYENEDIFETLYHYGMDDNVCCLKAFSVPWKQLVLKMYKHIGEDHFKFSSKVVNIEKINMSNNPCNFIIHLENGKQYMCKNIIIATTITGIRKLLPNYSIYNEIEGQPFLRLYAKFTKNSIPIMKEYVKGFTFLPGPLQRIIPMDPDNGVYMIAYNDNKNSVFLKDYRDNTKKNKEMYEKLLEKSLGIPNGSLHIIAIKDYYWPVGTHYYKPLDTNKYKNRKEFINEAQHPTEGIVVVGEVVSRNQGWVEGALQSVEKYFK